MKIETLKDSYDRKINYARISITDRCNMRCKYCMPSQGIDKKIHNEILSFENLYTIVKTLASIGIDKVRITGGEPLVRKGAVEFIQKICAIPFIKDTAMTTNGVLLNQYGEDLRRVGLKRLNISIDTLNEAKFRQITRGSSLKDTLLGIEKAKKLGFQKIKFNVVLIGGFNDDEIEDFVYMTEKEDIDVRFIELMPIGECSRWSLEKFIPVNRVTEICRELIPIKSQDKSSPAKYYKLPEGKGKVGLIEPISCKFCMDCNRIRITADGKLKTCLHSDEEIDLKQVLEQGTEDDLKNIILSEVNKKPYEHHLEKGDYIKRDMMKIGG